MRVCKHYFMNILLICTLFCVLFSCTNNTSSTNTMQNTAELLKQIYSLAENESVPFTVNNVKFQSNLDLSQIAYKDNVTVGKLIICIF